MKRKAENGKGTSCSSGNALQAEKENLFSKYFHVPLSVNYKRYPLETPLTRSTSSEMKDLSKKDELERMSTQGEIPNESEKNTLCLEKATAAQKVLYDDKKDNLDETLDDFQESQIEKRQKLKKRHESPIFACIMCQSDITHLDLKEREIHINQCIDGQSSTVVASQEISAESAFILDCPLCFKHFPTSEVRCAHIKKCGKSRGLSTQSVIQALRLQEKHVLERRALGLPLNNKPAKQPKKPAAKKFLIKPKSAMESDIQLARALSLSLEENENKTTKTSTDYENSQPVAILQAPSGFQNPGKIVSKKKMLKPTPLLLLRSEDERQKILLEKVNSIIALSKELRKDVIIEDVNNDKAEQKRTFLWNLCGKAEDKKAYYVEQLLDWISTSNVEVGSKLCNLSQIAGHRIFTQLPCDYTFSSADKNDDSNTVNEDSESPSLIKSLRSLIGNCWMSDVDIHTVSGIVIPAHKLFLALRCPSLKNVFDKPPTNGRHVLNWENTSFDAALHFLNFIYTGSAEWKEDIIDELHQLAVKYEVHDLLNILDSNKETLEMLIYDDDQENIEDSEMDMEIPSKSINQDTVPCAEQKLNFNKNSKHTYGNAETECQNANSGYFNDMDTSIEPTYENSNNLKNLVSDQDEVVCIEHTDVSKEMIVTENILSETIHVDEDILILNNHGVSHADKNDEKCSLNLEICDANSNSSNDSCKILKASISSESKTSFDTFQEEVINILSSKTPCTSENPTYCTSSYTSPSKPLVENINPLFEKSMHSGNVLSPKISPYTPCKSMLNECITPDMSPQYTVRNTFSPRNSLPSFSKTESNIGSSKKKSESLSNFRNEQIDEPVIILENEPNQTGSRETNHNSFLKKSCSMDTPGDRIFSPRKVSPWKVSKLKSPSFDDFDAFPRSQNLCVQNRSINFEQRDLDVQHPFLKGCSVSPDLSRFSSKEIYPGLCSEESPLNCYASSPKARPEISHFNKDNSFKRNLECSLNDNIYSMNSLSSPEILVCDSDNELEPIDDNECVPEKERICNNKIEAGVCNGDYKTPDSVFIQNVKENSSSSIKEKTQMPEIIFCHSDSNDDADVTIEFQSTQERNNVIFNKSRELHDSHLVECDKFSDKNECSPLKTNTDNPVLDIIDCCSNSNDNADVIEKLQTSSRTKETTFEDDDEYMDFVPLSERIEAAKSKTNSCKALEEPLQSSPESPWTFQSDKQCVARPLEKDPSILKSSVCTSRQNLDATPIHLPNKGKCKNPTTGNQTEKNNSAMTLNGLQPKFKISDSPVTPLPDYKSMVTPDLKQALKRVGVKALPRKKAVAVLSHIYNETHPWNDGKTGESLESQTQFSPKSTNPRKNLSLPKKRKQANEISDQPSKKTVKSHPKPITEVNAAATKMNFKPKHSSNTNQSSSSEQKYSSETKTSPEIASSPDGSNNSREDFYNLSSDFSDSSQPDSKENMRNVTQYILSNDELYKKVLTYSPLNLMEFQHELKENGLSISVPKLMDYLDEQCITFTCPRKEDYRKKQQVRTQRFRKRMIAKMSQQKS